LIPFIPKISSEVHKKFGKKKKIISALERKGKTKEPKYCSSSNEKKRTIYESHCSKMLKHVTVTLNFISFY
jgi:hypothetical protein